MITHTSNTELINHLINIGSLHTKRIIDAFTKIDRTNFVLPHHAEYAYSDHPLPISEKATISQPYTVACMLEWLQPHEWEKILDVGAGSWRTVALLAEMVWPTWYVYWVELDPDLVTFATENVKKHGFKNIKIIKAHDKLGYVEKSPFDKILVSASARHLPNELVIQLKVGGIMVVPVQNSILRIEKISDDKIKMDTFDWFTFVPLVH